MTNMVSAINTGESGRVSGGGARRQPAMRQRRQVVVQAVVPTVRHGAGPVRSRSRRDRSALGKRDRPGQGAGQSSVGSKGRFRRRICMSCRRCLEYPLGQGGERGLRQDQHGSQRRRHHSVRRLAPLVHRCLGTGSRRAGQDANASESAQARGGVGGAPGDVVG